MKLISRQCALHTAIATCLAAMATGTTLAAGQADVQYKKGVGNSQCDPTINAKLGVSWWYSWWLVKKNDAPTSEWAPEAWSYTDDKDGKFSAMLNDCVTKYHAKYLLGYNEPDGSGQGNMTVEKALEGWPLLMKTGLPLVSPSAIHADDQWMQDFMAGAKAKGYRVDYIGVHWYSLNATELLNYLEKVHKLYNKPIWITEFCPVDWTPQGRVTPQTVVTFIHEAIPKLNNLPYVARYAWYTSLDAPYGQASLFNKDGSLTEAGKAYAAMPPSASSKSAIVSKPVKRAVITKANQHVKPSKSAQLESK